MDSRSKIGAALLAVVALLVCHGALGSLHLVSHGDASHAGGSGMQPVVAGAGENGGSQSGSLGLSGYAAVLLALLSTALGLIPRLFRRLACPAPRPAARLPVLNRWQVFIRGPDPTLLQVFRL